MCVCVCVCVCMRVCVCVCDNGTCYFDIKGPSIFHETARNVPVRGHNHLNIKMIC